MPTLTTLVSFDGTNGSLPVAGLIADAAGNLFGTTGGGGPQPSDSGTVFEIARIGDSYASSPTTLISFPIGNGLGASNPEGSLIADAAGNLFGTTGNGGAGLGGTVFEIAKTGGSYASTPIILVSFSPNITGTSPIDGLIADAAGNLFGTTQRGGVNDGGTVFEIAKIGDTYSGTPTTLVGFNGTDGYNPAAGLIADAAGDLFGTTEFSGPNGDGTVFEIVKTGDTYASTPTILVSFNGTNGSNVVAGLIADSAGNLFGTTGGGGLHDDGTVFEIAKIGDTYASTPTTLVTFDGINGADPLAGLIADAAGNLFGTTRGDGLNNDGTVFEIVKSGDTYAGTPITLASFSGTDGSSPDAGLLADAAGNLFGTTSLGGTNNAGTVFELSGTGFQVTLTPSPTSLALFSASDSGTKGDDLTNVVEPKIIGIGEAGDTVILSESNTALGIATVGGDGTWDITTSALVDGQHALTATQTDANGNTSAPSAPLDLTIDTTAPPTPSVLALDPSTDSGTVGDGITSDTQPLITGTGESGDTVTLDDGVNPVGSAIVAPGMEGSLEAIIGLGSWQVASTSLALGAHSLTATETDIAGNSSGASAPLALTIVSPPVNPSGPILIFGDHQAQSGGPGDDTAWVSGGSNTVSGGDGNDLLGAFGDFNSLDGGPGNDTIWLTGNHDTVSGGPGNDTIGIVGDDGRIDLGTGGNTLYAIGNGNTISDSGDSLLFLFGANNTLTDSGNVFNDTIFGFDAAQGDRIHLTSDTAADALTHSSPANGGLDTQIALSNGSSILLKFVSPIDLSFFS
ncbi:MAG TPA: choice-of-anchor tandem repeat GloVer-containing protein [Stellaceae bacterium]|jgi:uncharacterized repeat protein (TIGR03803 family)|nr:choice-of-anchor tandem repeat GloVer-containing protein [Stellaceae bacterium]